MNGETLIALPGLTVTASKSGSFIDCRIVVDAHPFSGTIETVLTADHLEAFARTLLKLKSRGTARLGGNRAAELILEFNPQRGGTKGLLAVEASVCASGDDPWPRLEFLIFDVAPDFAKAVAQRCLELGKHPQQSFKEFLKSMPVVSVRRIRGRPRKIHF